jgi:Txe/YoeB family toxin of Txe-Axe toxin-antitoxin module
MKQHQMSRQAYRVIVFNPEDRTEIWGDKHVLNAEWAAKYIRRIASENGYYVVLRLNDIYNAIGGIENQAFDSIAKVEKLKEDPIITLQRRLDKMEAIIESLTREPAEDDNAPKKVILTHNPKDTHRLLCAMQKIRFTMDMEAGKPNGETKE